MTINNVKLGDEIVAPFGSYHLRVTNTDGDRIEGVYTKVPRYSYQRGSYCRYLKSDWHGRKVEYVER